MIRALLVAFAVVTILASFAVSAPAQCPGGQCQLPTMLNEPVVESTYAPAPELVATPDPISTSMVVQGDCATCPYRDVCARAVRRRMVVTTTGPMTCSPATCSPTVVVPSVVTSSPMVVVPRAVVRVAVPSVGVVVPTGPYVAGPYVRPLRYGRVVGPSYVVGPGYVVGPRYARRYFR